MTNQQYAHITLVVDRSGSMSSILSDAQGGIDTFLDSQFDASLGKTTVSIFSFDDTVTENVHFAEQRPTFVLKPRGGTALLDAIGVALVKTGETLRNLPEHERPGKVYFVVVTDGHENSSKEWKKDRIKTMLDVQQNMYGWEVIFLAADLSAVATGQSYGFYNSIQYNAGNSSGMYATVAGAVTRSRVMGASVAWSLRGSGSLV